jgi:hypothetical protein
MELGNRLAGLAREFGKETCHVFRGMTSLLGLVERYGERHDECFEPIEEALDQCRWDLGLSEHLFQSKLIAPFHD